MKTYDVYADIAERSGGNLYIGVVGPCRSGKSTFITKVMENVALPNISDESERERVIDELPQSGFGTSVMTTEPKFVPSNAINVVFNQDVNCKMRMVDCVGYTIDGIEGTDREVMTPWSEKKMSFNDASEFGTSKVITDHTNVGVVVTCDGTITDIPRENYIQAEKRVIQKLENTGKPFIIILNSAKCGSEYTDSLAMSLSEKYNKKVIPMDLKNLNYEDSQKVFNALSLEFDIVKFELSLPEWMQALPKDNDIIQSIVTVLSNLADNVTKMSETKDIENNILSIDEFENVTTTSDMATGTVNITAVPKEGLFYKTISQSVNMEINSDAELVSCLKELVNAKKKYEKIRTALDEVNETGYGIVPPSMLEMTLDEPKIIKTNGQFGVKLKAKASSLHIMRVDIDTEIKPAIGSEAQGQEMANSLLADFESNPNSLWETRLFGRPLNKVVNDGLTTKLEKMPNNLKIKMRKTLSKAVNDGKSNLITILL